AIESRWFSGSCRIHTYALDELLGTKLRALYQRKQGRDLFDMATALKSPDAHADRIVEAFLKYMEHEGHAITRPIRGERRAEDARPRVPVRHRAPARPWLSLGAGRGGRRRVAHHRAPSRRVVERRRRGP